MGFAARLLLEHPLEAAFLLVGMLVSGAAWAGWVVGRAERDARRAEREARAVRWRVAALLRGRAGRRRKE